MFYCYILQSEKSGKFYVGHSADVPARVLDHNRGHVTATRNKGPWQVAHIESFGTRRKAAARERQIKNWKSAELIRRLIEHC